MRTSLFTGCLRITLFFAIHTIVLLISESLLSNTSANVNSPKVSGYLSLFLYSVLLFVVSHVNLLHILRFAAAVDVVLEDNNRCLPNDI